MISAQLHRLPAAGDIVSDTLVALSVWSVLLVSLFEDHTHAEVMSMHVISRYVFCEGRIVQEV